MVDLFDRAMTPPRNRVKNVSAKFRPYRRNNQNNIPIQALCHTDASCSICAGAARRYAPRLLSCSDANFYALYVALASFMLSASARGGAHVQVRQKKQRKPVGTKLENCHRASFVVRSAQYCTLTGRSPCAVERDANEMLRK